MMDTTSHAGNCGYEVSLQQQEKIQYIWGERTEEMSRLWDNFHNSRNEMLMTQSTPLEPSVRNKIQQQHSTPMEEEEVLRREYFQHLAPQPSVLERRLSRRCEELQNTVATLSIAMNAQEARLHQRIEKFEGDMVRKSREMGKIGELQEEMWHMSRQTGRNKRNMQDKIVWSSSDGQNKCRRGKWSVEGERGRSQSLDRHQEKVEMKYGGIKRWEGNSVERLSSFGCGSSPCCAVGRPRLRFGSRDPGCKPPGASEVRSVHRPRVGEVPFGVGGDPEPSSLLPRHQVFLRSPAPRRLCRDCL